MDLHLSSVAFLVQEGYEDNIVIAHDIHTKKRLNKYGSQDYSHILKNIVAKMLSRVINQTQVDKALIENAGSHSNEGSESDHTDRGSLLRRPLYFVSAIEHSKNAFIRLLLLANHQTKLTSEVDTFYYCYFAVMY